MWARAIMPRIRPCIAAVVGLGLLWGGVSASSSAPLAAPQTASQGARNLTVLVGAGADTAAAFAYFPQEVRVRAGDTVTWRINSDTNHTVSFMKGWQPEGPVRTNTFRPPGELIPFGNRAIPDRPGFAMENRWAHFPVRSDEVTGDVYRGEGFVSSGRLRRDQWLEGLPNVESFSLTFETPGTYHYLCLLHRELMTGVVEVASASERDVPSQGEIDARAQQEATVVLGLIERSKAQPATPRRLPGPNNTSFSYVLAGNTQDTFNDWRVQLLEFLPKDVTITAGDTVIWTSAEVHTVTFIPTPPTPPLYFPEPQADGSLMAVRNPLIFAEQRPTGVFDPRQHYNSAAMGPSTPRGPAWNLTFEEPGTFEYVCAFHEKQGMKGTITVLPRT